MGAAGCIPADREFLQACAEPGSRSTARSYRRRSHDLPPRVRRRPGALRHHAGPDHVRQDHRRRLPGRRVRRPHRGHGASSTPATPNAVYQSGTFNGNAITTVAGIAAMELFPRDEVARINALGDQLRDGLIGELRSRGRARRHDRIRVDDRRSPGRWRGPELPRWRRAETPPSSARFISPCCSEGVFAAPRLMFCMSTPMTPEIVDDVIARFGRALDRTLA